MKFNLVFKLLVPVFSVLLLLGIIELGARIYLNFSSELKYDNHLDFRKSIPPPYTNSKYDVNEFLDATFGKITWYTPDNTLLVIPNDFENSYIKVKDGIRSTSFQPEVYLHTIYVLGGSTVFCAEVPDDYTMPSYLQKLINEKYKNKYRVVNLGASSVNITQEVERLKSISFQQNDIVIMFDGANDVLQSLYNDDPSGYIVGKNNNILKKLSPINKFIVFIYQRMEKYSAFVSHFLDPYRYNNTPLHLSDKTHMDLRKQEMEKIFVSNLILAQKYVEKQNAYFYHFLQPNLFSVNYFSIYEINLKENKYLVGAGIEEVFKFGYPVLESDVKQLKTKYAVNTYDLTKIFDNRDYGEELFLDWVHVADKGNIYIAKEIYEIIDKNNGF